MKWTRTLYVFELHATPFIPDKWQTCQANIPSPLYPGRTSAEGHDRDANNLIWGHTIPFLYPRCLLWVLSGLNRAAETSGTFLMMIMQLDESTRYLKRQMGGSIVSVIHTFSFLPLGDTQNNTEYRNEKWDWFWFLQSCAAYDERLLAYFGKVKTKYFSVRLPTRIPPWQADRHE